MRCGLAITSFCFICQPYLTSLSWVLVGPSKSGLPKINLILTAAIVTTIPIVFVTLYTCFTCVFLKLYSSDIRLKDRHIIHSWNCIKSFALIIQMVAAITEVGGAVLFLVAGYTEQSGSIRSIGHVAGMISIMTSCCCFFLLPFFPDNCVNLNWRQLQCTCKSTYCSVSV